MLSNSENDNYVHKKGLDGQLLCIASRFKLGALPHASRGQCQRASRNINKKQEVTG